MKGCTEYGTNIQIYIDGELTGEERNELLSHVKDCPSCRQVMQETERFSLRVRAARPAVTASDSLRATVLLQMQQVETGRNEPRLLPRRTPDRRVWFLTAVAAVLVLVAGGLLVNRQRQKNQAGTIIQAAILAHQELEQHALPLDITSNSSEEVSSWFQSRVSFPFHMANSGIASDVTAQYKLTGGRLLMVNNEPVALVVFSVPRGMATLVICPEYLMKAFGGTVVNSGGVILHSQDQGSLHIVTWNERGLGYVLTFATKSISNARQCSSCHSENSTDETTHAALLSRM